ncbi:MAG: hypothetical protein ACI9WU_004655 [Myxococcota bacterium]|jgi:hypothetical protein
MKFLILALLLAAGCGKRASDAPEGAAAAVDPAAADLHERLLAAAAGGRIDAFKGLLTQSSVALFETHFAGINALPRRAGEAPLGWAQILRFHADLPEGAQAATPYPVVKEAGKPRLDLAGHADARFFEAVAGGLAR